MEIYLTEITAIHPHTGELCKWSGPRIKSISIKMAQEYCDTHQLGYCKVIGILGLEVKYNGETIDYDATKNN